MRTCRPFIRFAERSFGLGRGQTRQNRRRLHKRWESAQPLPRIVCCHLISKWGRRSHDFLPTFFLFSFFCFSFWQLLYRLVAPGDFCFISHWSEWEREKRENELRVDIFILLYTSSWPYRENERNIRFTCVGHARIHRAMSVKRRKNVFKRKEIKGGNTSKSEGSIDK